MSDMSTIERVARAIDPRAFACIEADRQNFWAHGRCAEARRQARAAIEAMRKMTPEVLSVLDDAVLHLPPSAEFLWNKLIDAVLAPPTDGAEP